MDKFNLDCSIQTTKLNKHIIYIKANSIPTLRDLILLPSEASYPLLHTSMHYKLGL